MFFSKALYMERFRHLLPRNDRNDLLMHHYNDNIRTYNENTRICLELLRNLQSSTNHSMEATIDETLYQIHRSARQYSSIISSYLDSSSRESSSDPLVSFTLYPILRPTGHDNTGLTSDEINQETEQTIYDCSGVLTQTVCPIALETFQNGEQVTTILRCGHTFRSTMFDDWFRSHTTCPVCYDALFNAQDAFLPDLQA